MSTKKEIMNTAPSLIQAIGTLVERLTLPGKEKRQLQADIVQLLPQEERQARAERAAVTVEESHGNWLQRSWRPLVMLVFTAILLVGTFTELPLLADTSRFWDLLELGLGGYVIGRSGEKIARAWLAKNLKL